MGILLVNLIPAFGIYEPPTKREQKLYNQLLAEFTKLDIQKKDVSDVLSTFDKPLVVTFPCNYTHLNTLFLHGQLMIDAIKSSDNGNRMSVINRQMVILTIRMLMDLIK